LIDQKEPTLNLENQSEKKENLDLVNNLMYYKKIIEPSKEELDLHKKFLKKSLKKNYFN